MKAKLFLDDIRPCPDGYILVRNYDDCITLLEYGVFEVVSLDYSLGEYRTGLSVLEWLNKHKDHLPQKLSVHSTHSYGRDQMVRYVKTHLPEVELIHPEFKQLF